MTNPRWNRLLAALLRGPVYRHQLDNVIGAENSPDIVMKLRRELGLLIPCAHVPMIDRDGRKCRPGLYSLSEHDRTKVLRLQREAQAAPELPQATIPRPTPRKRDSGPQRKRKGRK